MSSDSIDTIIADLTTGVRKLDMQELGTAGLEHQRGVIMEEPLRTLSGERGRKIFREMSLNDDVVGAALMAIRMLVRQVEWWEEPASPDADDEANAQFLGEVREDMSHTWQAFIEEVLSMLVYGWSYHEIVWKRRNGPNRQPGLSSRYTDNRIGIRKLPIRGQETLFRWDLDETDGIDGMNQRHKGKMYYVPIDKALLFRFGMHKNNPEGASALRNAWRSWYFKKNIQEVEAIGIERELAGLAIAKIPPQIMASDASAQERAIYEVVKDILVNVRRDEQAGIAWPLAYDENGNELYKFELLSAGGARQVDTDDIINRYDRGIAGSLLADFILLGHEQHGSFALSADKTSLFAVALGSVLDSIEQVLNRHLVPRLFRINGVLADDLPQWKHGDIERQALKDVAEFIEALSKAGAPLFPDEDLEAHLREIADLPPKSQDATGLQPLMDLLPQPDSEAAPRMDEGAPTDAEAETSVEEGIA